MSFSTNVSSKPNSPSKVEKSKLRSNLTAYGKEIFSLIHGEKFKLAPKLVQVFSKILHKRLTEKFAKGTPDDFFMVASVPSHFLFDKWLLPSICNLKMAVVHGLCYADLYFETLLENNLNILREASKRAYTNLHSMDLSPEAEVPPVKTKKGEIIPGELMQMSEKVRPDMRIFLKSFLTSPTTLSPEAIQKSKLELLSDPLMSFAVNASFVRLLIDAGKEAFL